MAILSGIFKKSAPVQIGTRALFDAVLRHEHSFDVNNDYTDQVFLTLGIGRIHHLKAETKAVFSRPAQTFEIPVLNDIEHPSTFAGSEAAFITAYTSWGKTPALGIVIRDQIVGRVNTARERHVVAALGGCFTDPENFTVRSLIQARFNPRGKVAGLDHLPVTDENAGRVLASISLNLQQILDGERLDASGNARQVRNMSQDAVKSLTFRP